MFQSGSIIRVRWILALVAGFGAIPALAASINYGNFGPVAPGIAFINVTEEVVSDPLPLFGPPSAHSIGMDFDPIGFVAHSQGGSPDVTQSKLKFTLLNNLSAAHFSEIHIWEVGDLTKVGTGTAATSVSANALIEVTMTEVNGVAIAPITLTPVNATTGFSLPGSSIVQPWSLQSNIDVLSQMFDLGFSHTDMATRLDVTITNTLSASSEPQSAASIAKKDFRVELVLIIYIPEPGSLLLCAAACSVLLARRRS